MIWLSEYRDVFIKNSFGLVYENSLLLTSTNFRGDYTTFYGDNNITSNSVAKPSVPLQPMYIGQGKHLKKKPGFRNADSAH